MLKNLESRRNTVLPDGNLMSGEHPDTGSRGPRPLTLILIILVLLLALGLGYVWLQNNRLQAVTPSEAAVATVSAPLVEPQPTTTPTPNGEPKRVLATPQRSATDITAPLPALVTKASAEVPRTTAADARLRSVSPSVVDGSWAAQDFTLRGESLGAPLQVVVSWGTKEKILPNDRVQWLDSNIARVSLVTGNADEIWRIALIYPDGRRSTPVDFEVIASPYARSSGTTTQSTTSTTSDGQMKKVIHPPSSHEQADQLYQQGYHALQQRKADIAEQLWQRALKTEPSHLKSREGLIALTLSQGRKIEASQLLEEAVAHHPQSGQFAMLHARLLAEQGDTTAAITALEQAMGHNEQQPQLFALAAAFYQQQRNFDNSIRAYQRALQPQPHQANWWMGLAISLEGAAKNEEAISAYKEAQQRGGLNKESKAYVKQRLEALE